MCHFCDLERKISRKDWPLNCQPDIADLVSLLEDAHNKQTALTAAELAAEAQSKADAYSRIVKQKSLPPTPSRRPATHELLGARSALPLLASQTRRTDVPGGSFHSTNGKNNSTHQATATSSEDLDWPVKPAQKARYDEQFAILDARKKGYVTREDASQFFVNSELPPAAVDSIWKLSDIDGDDRLNVDEFAVACYLTKREWRRINRGSGKAPFEKLPIHLIPPNMRAASLAAGHNEATKDSDDDSIRDNYHREYHDYLQEQQKSPAHSSVGTKSSGVKNQLKESRDALKSTLRAIESKIEAIDVHRSQWYRQERLLILERNNFFVCATGNCVLQKKASLSFMCFCNQSQGKGAIAAAGSLSRPASELTGGVIEKPIYEASIASAVRIVSGARLVSSTPRSPSSIYDERSEKKGSEAPAERNALPDELETMLEALATRQKKQPEIVNNWGEVMQLQVSESLQSWMTRIVPLTNLQSRNHECIQQLHVMRFSFGSILRSYVSSRILTSPLPAHEKRPAGVTMKRDNPPSAWTGSPSGWSFGAGTSEATRTAPAQTQGRRNLSKNAFGISGVPVSPQAFLHVANLPRPMPSAGPYGRGTRSLGVVDSVRSENDGSGGGLAARRGNMDKGGFPRPTDATEHSDDFGSFLDNFRKGHPFTPTKEVESRSGLRFGTSMDMRSASLTDTTGTESHTTSQGTRYCEATKRATTDSSRDLANTEAGTLRRKKGSDSLRSLSTETTGDSETFMAAMTSDESHLATPTKLPRMRLMERISKKEMKKRSKEEKRSNDGKDWKGRLLV